MQINNIKTFNETIEIFKNDIILKYLTSKALDSTKVIDENFISNRSPVNKNSSVRFLEATTLQEAERLFFDGKKVAVLNFANPVEQGGGVLRGANAQEEYLCRASNLYFCLCDEKSKDYYDYHRSIFDNSKEFFIASDKIIYSKDVTVIRTDNYDRQEYTDNWYKIDVITCAAPFFQSKNNILSDSELYKIFCSRIQNILESAIDNEVEALVLGAFGCGAFHNPPSVVAKAFHDVLLKERYKNAFLDVVFAVKRTGDFCENIEAFEIEFSRFPEVALLSAERNKRRFFE